MADTGFRYYRNNLGYVEALPWAGNIPSGYTPITREEFLKQTDETGARTGMTRQWWEQKYPGVTTGTGQSGLQIVNGVPWQTSAINEEAKNEAAVKAGTMKKIKIGKGYGYVPVNAPDIKGGGGTGIVGGAPGSSDGGGGATVGGTPSGITPPPASSAFKNSAAYKGLSADEQALVDMAFSTFTGTEEQQRIFADALSSATVMADPYAKAQLNLFRGEYESKIAYNKGDLERASEIVTRTRDELSQDVSSAKEFLTLQQQAEIAQETTKYSEDLLTIADQAAEKGITFATGARSRALAEERRGAQFEDVIQSGRREYNFRIKEKELQASRGDIKAQQDLADIRAKSSFQLEDIGRSAEKVLGSGNVPGGTGYTPSGNVLGEIEQNRRKSILDLAGLGIPK